MRRKSSWADMGRPSAADAGVRKKGAAQYTGGFTRLIRECPCAQAQAQGWLAGSEGCGCTGAEQSQALATRTEYEQNSITRPRRVFHLAPGQPRGCRRICCRAGPGAGSAGGRRWYRCGHRACGIGRADASNPERDQPSSSGRPWPRVSCRHARCRSARGTCRRGAASAATPTANRHDRRYWYPYRQRAAVCRPYSGCSRRCGTTSHCAAPGTRCARRHRCAFKTPPARYRWRCQSPQARRSASAAAPTAAGSERYDRHLDPARIDLYWCRRPAGRRYCTER